MGYNANTRGYFGIGIFNGKDEKNVGTLWRSAAILGADFIFTIGNRYHRQCSDTMNTPKHIPLYAYSDFSDFKAHLPFGCPVVAVELSDRAVMIEEYEHRERCVYLLGAEDHGIPDGILAECHDIVQLQGEFCYNVSVAGSIVMYDRMQRRLKK